MSLLLLLWQIALVIAIIVSVLTTTITVTRTAYTPNKVSSSFSSFLTPVNGFVLLPKGYMCMIRCQKVQLLSLSLSSEPNTTPPPPPPPPPPQSATCETNNNNLSSLSSSSSSSSSVSYKVLQHYSRNDAERIVNEILLPTNEYGRRIGLRSEKLSNDRNNNMDNSPKQKLNYFTASDPILQETYGEFPLPSLDILVDRAEQLLSDIHDDYTSTIGHDKQWQQQQQQQQMQRRRRRTTIVDVGSGCGRLALYLSLSRGSTSTTSEASSITQTEAIKQNSNNDNKNCNYWDIHGIELLPMYHTEAIKAASIAVESAFMTKIDNNDTTTSILQQNDNNNNNNNNHDYNDCMNYNTVQFHVGPVHEYIHILQKADIIFCYSTAFGSKCFSENIVALLLDDYWNTVFANCSYSSSSVTSSSATIDPTGSSALHKQVIVITTEKALDPSFVVPPWIIVDRINVPNPEVYESTGYIQMQQPTIKKENTSQQTNTTVRKKMF